MSALTLLGLATAVPEHAIPTDLAAQYAESFACETPAQRRMLSKLYNKTGVSKRHSALLKQAENGMLWQDFYPPRTDIADRGPRLGKRMLKYREQAPKMAQRACEQALAECDVSAGEITHLITVSCTGFAAPGVDIALIEALGLPPTVQRTHVGFMGCHGAINGLRAAQAYAAADPSATILLCAVELCSLHYHYGWHPEQLVANALFADGAAALVARSGKNHAEKWHIEDTASYLIPGTREMMSWQIADHAFEMTLSAQLPERIESCLAEFLEGWLGKRDLSIAMLEHFIVHPGGPRVLQAVEAALGLAENKLAHSRQVLRDYGNMSSPTILFILDLMRRQEQPGPGVIVGFGPGVVAECALVG